MMLEIHVWDITLTLVRLGEIIFKWECEKELNSGRFCMWTLAGMQMNDLINTQTEFI